MVKLSRSDQGYQNKVDQMYNIKFIVWITKLNKVVPKPHRELIKTCKQIERSKGKIVSQL